MTASSTAILLLGHGSRAPEANTGMYQVAADLQETGNYLKVECAFLELNSPDIPQGLTNCREAGAQEIIVIPFFLHLGRHVKEDLPRIIGEWQRSAPGVKVITGQPFGYSRKLVELVEERIAEALTDRAR
ncbi:MAG TPA: CbiX/SirB N-terminal domain-containing protein [Chloroflexia bacterium]|nr:CbiX/SirB N-terminal domain-containing protein [Chloroflexia bacterium]